MCQSASGAVDGDREADGVNLIFFMITHYCINGVQVPVGEAMLHVSDLSILRGHGVFDYFMTRHGHPLFWEDYCGRFERSATMAGLQLQFTADQLLQQVYDLMHTNNATDVGVRFVLTGGYSEDSFTPPTHGNMIIMLHELPSNVWEVAPEGLKIISFDFQRDLPYAKTINYGMGIRLMPLVHAAGAKDLLYHDGGWVRESARSNFGIITFDGKLVTSSEAILHGVTRKHILAVAREAGIVVEERDYHMDEIKTASEAFFTSTTKGILSVSQVDDHLIRREPGPVVQRLQALFIERVEHYLANIR
jgi:branched-chain amino acid aminotransferase